MIAPFRSANWLTADRTNGYAIVLGLALLVFAAGAFGTILEPAWYDPAHRPVAADFDAFWSSGRLALAGHAAAAYDGRAITAAEDIGARMPPGHFLPYLYPPVLTLLFLPFAALPYLLAMPAFLVAGYAANVACLRRILPAPEALLPILVLPGSVINAVIGQNGCVSATCFGGAMLLLDRYPGYAGACLGVFVFKPHLAICIPLALAAAQRWRAFFACAACAIALVAASWLAFGSAAWLAFLTSSSIVRAVLASHEIWPKLVSTYAGIRLLHGGVALAYAGQAIVSLASLACVGWVCARRPGGRAEMAVLAVAALLCTPYAMDYDLVCLGVPMAWLASRAIDGGWRDYEKIVLASCYVLPLFARLLNLSARIPAAPILLLCLLYVTARRATRSACPAAA